MASSISRSSTVQYRATGDGPSKAMTITQGRKRLTADDKKQREAAAIDADTPSNKVPPFLNFTRKRNCNSNESLLDSNRLQRNNLSPVPAPKTTGLDPSELGTEKGAQEPDAEQEQLLRAIKVSRAEAVKR